MRLIGYLPNQGRAATFSQFLQIQGITNTLEAEQDGWAIWVHSEDELEQARSHLKGFLAHPEDSKFRVAALTAKSLPAGKGMMGEGLETVPGGIVEGEAGEVWAFGLGPLTLGLILACMAVGLGSVFGANLDLLSPLFLTSFEVKGELIYWQRGLPEVRVGELWRLVTPVFVHFGILHLLLNMLWLLYLGSMVEACERTVRLAWVVGLVAVVSNLGEYWMHGPNFGGMSGVVYGLLGYVWIKCRRDRSAGYRLSLTTVTFMLVWFFLCLAGIVPGVANGAHAFGLGGGVACGYFVSKREGRRVLPRGAP